MPNYSAMPSKDQWVNDSFVLLAKRNADSVLSRIDNIVDAYWKSKSGGECIYLLGELFFATDMWLKIFKQNSNMRKEREAAVHNLFAFTAQRLASICHCTVATLPNALEVLYGKSLSAYGRDKDNKELGTHHYMQRAEANKFRLIFKSGLAYQFPYRPPGTELKLVNSEDWKKLNADQKATKPGFAFFVMSMGRDLFMGPHMNVSKGSTSVGKVAMVHSSWLAGMPVQCGGSMSIDDGVVNGLQNNSGHYQPTDSSMVNVLQLLQTVGADLRKVSVYNYDGKEQLPGHEFLKANGNWENILKRLPRPGTQPGLNNVVNMPKQRYRCGSCGSRFEYLVAFCPNCHGKCVAA